MRTTIRWCAAVSVASLSLTLAACGDSGGEDDDGTAGAALEGKRVTLIVPNQPGNGMDNYARMIAPYLTDCLGASRITVKNETGAGGVVGTNDLWHRDPNGLTFEFTSITGIVLAAVADSPGVEYDSSKFVYLGRAAAEPRVFTVGKKSDIDSVEDLKALSDPFLYPSPGPDQDFFLAAVLSEEMGFPLKFVTGFEGQSDSTLAIQKGNADGQIWAYSSVKPFIDSGDQIPLMVMSSEPMPELPGVPAARDLVSDPTALDAFIGLNDFHRGFFGPPGLSKELTAELREGVSCALSDKELQEKAEKAQLPLSPLSGAKLQTAIDRIYPQLTDLLAPIFKRALESIK